MCGYFLFHETTQYYQIVNLTNKAPVRIPGPLQLKDNICLISGPFYCVINYYKANILRPCYGNVMAK